MATAQISGRALLGALKYAKALGEDDGPGALICSLPVDAREIFGTSLKASAWYPYSVYSGLLAAIESWPDHKGSGHKGSGGEPTEPMLAFGHWALQQDAGTILKILRIFSGVEGLVHRGFGAWGAFLWKRHCDAGEVFLVDKGVRTATMGLRGFPAISPAHCRLTCGYLEAMGRAVGAHSIRMIKTRCVHRGDAHCEYRGEWE